MLGPQSSDLLAFIGVGSYCIARRLLATVPRAKIPVARKRAQNVLFGRNLNNLDEFRGEKAMNPPRVMMDNYFWLRDDERKSKEIFKHITAENTYTETLLEHQQSYREDLYQELLSHVQETDERVPYRKGSYLYTTMTKEGLSYPIHVRRPLVDGHDDVYLNENVLADGKSHCDVGDICISPCDFYFAYSVDFKGDEIYDIHFNKFRDTADDAFSYCEVIHDTSGDLEWGNDKSCVFYSTLDSNHRPCKLWFHAMGTPQSSDLCIMEEEDESFWMSVTKTCSDKFLLVSLSSTTSSEEWLLDLTNLIGSELHANAAKNDLFCIEPRSDDHRYSAEHVGDELIILTNKDGCRNNKLVRLPLCDVNRRSTESRLSNWLELVPYDETHMIDALHVMKHFVVVCGRKNGLTDLTAFPVVSNGSKLIDFDMPIRVLPDDCHEEAFEVDLTDNAEFNTDVLRYTFESMTAPRKVLDLNLRDGSQVLKKEDPVPNYDRSQYASVRLYVPSRDGSMRIPLSVVLWRDLDSGKALKKLESMRNSKNDDADDEILRDLSSSYKVLMYGYGSYGICIEPDFDSTRLPLLDRGIIYIIAHIRGGGEFGRYLYESQGKFLTKKNTFADFIDCARYLIEYGVTAPNKLAIIGRSAGGLLIGNCVNTAPELFRVAVADVPFVDLMNSMCDPGIPLTISEWEEWGNPNEEKYYQYMLEYSPYDNVRPTPNFPSLLATGGLYDPRVAYWEPVKWIAKIRDCMKTVESGLDDEELARFRCSKVCLKIDLTSGHFSASDRYKKLKERAFEYSFIIHELNR